MNGKDIFLGLKYIGEDLIEEAEFGQFPAKRETESSRKRRAFRRPFLIAAIIAMALLLAGCAVAYVLKMQDLKVDEQVDVVYAVDGDTGIAAETVAVTQQVLTLSGLDGTPAYQAAKEWYEFKQAYDPDHLIQVRLAQQNAIPEFPAEYDAYNIYTQEMKDKLDQIVEKYGLNLMGAAVDFRTTKQMCRALGMESVLTADSEASMQITGGICYECGNLNLDYAISLPGEAGNEPVDTWGTICYRRKDCFAEDVQTIGDGALIGEDYGAKEWNYTTKDGNHVLIVRSSSDWRAWLFCDRPGLVVSLMAEARFESYSDDAEGNQIIQSREMTDRQLELLAESIDFSVVPEIDLSGDLTGGAAGDGAAIGGYTLQMKSAVTDGYVGYVTLGITAPEGMDLGAYRLDCRSGDLLLPADGGGKGSTSMEMAEDGDGNANTCNLVIRIDDCWEAGAAPFAPDRVWNLYFEDLIGKYWDGEAQEMVAETLVEGTWSFNLTFEGDTRAIELVSEPVTVQTTCGKYMDGTYHEVEVNVHSFVLRSFGASAYFEEGVWADFATEDHHVYAVMRDGSTVELTVSHGRAGRKDLLAERTIDLDQADYVLLADGTRLEVPK